MGGLTCRACRGGTGHLVLDLGQQPSCDYFPLAGDPGPDPEYPLQMWLCASCGLAQLAADPTVPEEPAGTEPAALAAQAADAVRRVAAAGLLPAPGSGRVAEFPSPHGGSWLARLAGCGVTPAADGEPAAVVLDCFGMMHAADQAAALDERLSRVAPGGVLLLQFHALSTIVGRGQWNALRHGHYAYYSATALAGLLDSRGFTPHQAWRFELYGGTVLLAASRDGDPGAPGDDRDGSVRALLADDERAGVRDPRVLSGLQRDALAQAEGLRQYLAAQRRAGHPVIGYGAASRAVALLRRAGIDEDLLPAVVDASPAKHGRRMPGTGIPVVGPGRLAELAQAGPPLTVLMLLADLLPEVRTAFPAVQAAGGRWVTAEACAPPAASRSAGTTGS